MTLMIVLFLIICSCLKVVHRYQMEIECIIKQFNRNTGTFNYKLRMIETISKHVPLIQ